MDKITNNLVKINLSEVKVNDLVYLDREGYVDGPDLNSLALAKVTIVREYKGEPEIGVVLLENYNSRDFPAPRGSLIYCYIDNNVFYKAIEIQASDLETNDIVLANFIENQTARVKITSIDKDYYNSEFSKKTREEHSGDNSGMGKANVEIELELLDRTKFNLDTANKGITIYDYIETGTEYQTRYYKLVDTDKKTMFKRMKVED